MGPQRRVDLEQAVALDLDADGGRFGAGLVQLDRGCMLSQLGRHEKSRRVFQRALELLPEYEQRWRLSAYQGVASAYRELGDVDRAKQCLEVALEGSAGQGGVLVAKLIWLKGLILGDKKHYSAASQNLNQAMTMLSARKSPLDVALVGLDLASSLLKEGKRNQALTVVCNMTVLTVRFRGNKLAEAALVELTEAGLHGRISQELIDRTASELRKGASKRGYARANSSRWVR